MALPLIAAGVGAAASGAAGGMMRKGEKPPTPEYLPEQKPFMRAAQAQIPLYLQTMTGGMPDFLRRYLMQTQGALQQQMGQGAQDYLRQMGMRGMDFGPAAQAGLSNIYSSAIPALAQGLTQSRMGIMGQTMKGMQQWSMMRPGGMTAPKTPSPGRMAAAGALQGVGRALGQPAQPKQPQRARPGTPPYQMAEPSPAGQQAARGWLGQQTAGATGLSRYMPGGIPGMYR